MKVLIIVDKKQSAIDRLATTILEYNDHFDIQIQSLHPKRPSVDEVENVERLWDWADIIHVSYWKSGVKFKELFPQLWRTKPRLLWHHNPYDIDQHNWTELYDMNVVHNKDIHSKIPYAKYIPQCIDLNFYEYNDKYTDEKVVNMVASRIEGKKGVLEVARACNKLGYKFLLVGRISDRNYFKRVEDACPDMDFRENVTDEELKQAYSESAIHVCNSVDNFESGTMPILEAMACGVPVLTRNIGHVPDLYDGDNMEIRYGASTDEEDLEHALNELMENKPLRDKYREKAWKTVKNRPAEKMARMFSTLYYRLYGGEDELVSIITPTFDKPEVLAECLLASTQQTYKNIEIIVIDSGNTSARKVVDIFKRETNTPIKYIRFKNHGDYTLPKARNKGIIEAEGMYVTLCDERIGMAKDAIQTFLHHLDLIDNIWMYGTKDNYEKGFVENFSFVKRSIIINGGMFKERIDCYGGASEDIRKRWGREGVLFESVVEAQATAISKSSRKHSARKDIIRAKQILWKLYG